MIALFFALAFVFVSETNAQNRRGRRIWNDRGNAGSVAQSQGRSDGLREGIDDARKRKRRNPYGKGRYKKATNGYDSRYGNKEVYKRAYRQAFLRGYDEGYDRNNRNNRGRFGY